MHGPRVRWSAATVLVGLAVVGAGPAHGASPSHATGDWPMYGQSATGARSTSTAGALAPSRVKAGLSVKWRYAAPGGPVYGTPAVVAGRVYDADMSGDVFALDAKTGSLLWATRVGPVADYFLTVSDSPLVTDVPSTTPLGTASSGQVIVGDQSGRIWTLDRDTGLLLWQQRPNTFGYPAVWGSAVLARVRTGHGVQPLVLVGIASNEETFTPTTAQPCCSSRGSVVALDPTTGAVVWQTFTISPTDAASGASGAGIWSTPSYDPDLNLVYVTTGNNYGNQSSTASTKTSDAVIAVNAADGRVVWNKQLTPGDTFVIAERPDADHPDSDFGDSPKLFRLRDGRKVVAAGQKNGFMHVLDASTGAVITSAQYLPRGGLGGFFATGAEAGGVVFANGNEWPDYGGGEVGGLLGSLAGTSPPITAGDVVAIRVDAATGQRELWRFRRSGTAMMGPVAVADSVVYVHATMEGELYALDAATGHVLAHVDAGPAVNGPSIADGTLFIGYGDTAGFAGTNPAVGGVVAIGPG